MQSLSICGIETNYEPSLLSPASLALEVQRCRDEGVPWFYYRDIIMSAQAIGLINITQHQPGRPFWWFIFATSVEILPPMQAIFDRQAAHDAKH